MRIGIDKDNCISNFDDTLFKEYENLSKYYINSIEELPKLIEKII